MTRCNDPKCPLNRHGVPHELHDVIESEPVTDPCNDPRCPMNRMGLPHNLHVEQYTAPQEETRQEKRRDARQEGRRDARQEGRRDARQEGRRDARQKNTESSQYNPFFDESLFEKMTDDILNELGKNMYRENPEQFNTHYTSNDRFTGGDSSNMFRGAQASPPPRPPRPPPPPRKPPQRQALSEDDRILRAKEPNEIFGVSKDVTLKEVKARYRELAKKYDASKGILNKSKSEKERSNKIMVKINYAYTQLKITRKSHV